MPKKVEGVSQNKADICIGKNCRSAVLMGGGASRRGVHVHKAIAHVNGETVWGDASAQQQVFE